MNILDNSFRLRASRGALSMAAALLAPIACGDSIGSEPLELEATGAALLEPIQSSGEYSVSIESDDPELPDETITNLVNTFLEVYPRERERFNPSAPLDVSFIFKATHPYPATALPAEITFHSKHFINNPEDWDVVTHEAMHLIQYPSLGPSWLIEGISDYVRDAYGVHNQAAGWFLTEDPGKYYNAGYRHTALFLQSIEQTRAPGLVDDVTAALLAGSYTEALWVELTGSTLDQLWNEYRPSFPLPSEEVTLFSGPDYAGDDVVLLGPGSYDVLALTSAGIQNDDLSSLWVPPGLEVQLFFDGDFSGTVRAFDRNVPSLASEGAEDTISSLIVTRR